MNTNIRNIVIALIVGSITLICAVTATYLVLNATYEAKLNEYKLELDALKQKDDSNKTDNNVENNTSDSDSLKTKTFTNSAYPNLSIQYKSDWNLKETMSNNAFVEENVLNKIDLTKNGAKLTIELSPSPAFGWGNNCYTKSDFELTSLNNKWFRISNDNGFTYTKNIALVSTMSETESKSLKTAFSYSDEEWATFEYCGAAGQNDSAMSTRTTYTGKNIAASNGTLSAILQIRFQGNDVELSEADAIVANSQF